MGRAKRGGIFRAHGKRDKQKSLRILRQHIRELNQAWGPLLSRGSWVPHSTDRTLRKLAPKPRSGRIPEEGLCPGWVTFENKLSNLIISRSRWSSRAWNCGHIYLIIRGCGADGLETKREWDKAGVWRWPVFKEDRHSPIYWLDSQERGKLQEGGVREGTRFGSGKHVINRAGDRSSSAKSKSASRSLWSKEREGAGRYQEIKGERAPATVSKWADSVSSRRVSRIWLHLSHSTEPGPSALNGNGWILGKPLCVYAWDIHLESVPALVWRDGI